ncbi:hypothetical protein [Rhizobium sp. RAF56]|uniref:hypothetical protein n=1 Tax=Rhizobium sp. RAF56 TaxID=3233062 RepID=UPI003F9563EB
MNNPKSVAFLFAYVPRMPTSDDELSRISVLRTQSAIMYRYARNMGLEPPDRLLAITTYRAATFTRNLTFKRAVAQARDAGTGVWVADVWQLLRRTPAANVTSAVEDLDNLDIDVLDCLSGKTWKQFGAPERLALVRDAFSRKFATSVSWPPGAAPKGQAPDIRNALKGASANKTKAERRAEQLRPVVDAFGTTLNPRQTLTPSLLMHHLNAEGILPERGKAWSLNSCKNLLHRLRSSGE